MGQVYQPTADDVRKTLEQAVVDLGDRTQNAEIAFFGGSFTAIDKSYMTELLDATKGYIQKFKGIRLSTRPDCVDNEVLEILKSYNVTSIELGAQSMDEKVLKLNERGHTAKDVINASKLIREYGFSLGLQMMTGLYGSDFYKDIYTADEFIKLRPDTVRIYPTVIMKDTKLAQLYLSGKFKPYSLEESVNLCSELLLKFERENIAVIRLGLHYSDSLIDKSYGDNYHPAFKELCENKIFFNKTLFELEKYPDKEKKDFIVFVNSKSLSKFIGQKKCNIEKLENLGYHITPEIDNSLNKYEIKLK